MVRAVVVPPRRRDNRSAGTPHSRSGGAGRPVETIGLLAHLTVEVGVLVVIVVVAVTVAEFIAYAVAAAFNGMYEMVLTEEREGSEDIRLVNGLDPALQLG